MEENEERLRIGAYGFDYYGELAEICIIYGKEKLFEDINYHIPITNLIVNIPNAQYWFISQIMDVLEE